MKAYRLRNLEVYGPPRWDLLRPRDAIALVGYAYGYRASSDPSWSTRHVANELLMSALFCAGAPWDEIEAVSQVHVETIVGAKEQDRFKHPAGFAIRLKDCVRLSFIFGSDDASKRRLQSVVLAFAEAWEKHGLRSDAADDVTLAELRLHGASLTGDRGLLPRLPEASELPRHSLVEPVLRSDAAAFAEAVDDAVMGARNRGAHSANPGAEPFDKRVQGFQDWGRAFVHAGSRGIGEAFGLALPPPAPETLLFYRPGNEGGPRP